MGACSGIVSLSGGFPAIRSSRRRGSVVSGREGLIRVISYEHGMTSPRDASSGLPTGKHQHKALTITKEFDRSSPLLVNALINNENIGDELMNASIAGIQQEMLNIRCPEHKRHNERECISFCYQRIRWTWMDGGITAEDGWSRPTV
ncbi:MAG: type VI secretion system tube protein Hcp [Synechococcaceae cyanobacterium]|nr:type VI secretion system tube protein Hcp [Synechococcaceae cyanobacterium]